MTTVFECRFTDPDEYLTELRADHERGMIQDRIVRLAIRNGTATAGLIEKRRYLGSERAVVTFRSRFVEASYISTRQQLVKLSAYCGVEYIGPTQDAHDPAHQYSEGGIAKIAAMTEDTAKAVQEMTRKVQRTIAQLDGLDVRGGGLFVEDGGAWVADPESPIEAPAEIACITCIELIYFANGQWRHKETGRAEALRQEPCQRCGGTGNEPSGNANYTRKPGRCLSCLGRMTVDRLDHLADPLEENRKV